MGESEGLKLYPLSKVLHAEDCCSCAILAGLCTPMTIGRGSSLPSTMALLLAAVLGVGLFVLAYARAGESSITFV
jgi:hypothetical protein